MKVVAVIPTCEAKARASVFMIESQNFRVYTALSLIKWPQRFITGSYDQMISWLQGHRFVRHNDYLINSVHQQSTVIKCSNLKFRSYTKLNQIWKTSLMMITAGQRYGYHSSRPYWQQIRVKTLERNKMKITKGRQSCGQQRNRASLQQKLETFSHY